MEAIKETLVHFVWNVKPAFDDPFSSNCTTVKELNLHNTSQLSNAGKRVPL